MSKIPGYTEPETGPLLQHSLKVRIDWGHIEYRSLVTSKGNENVPDSEYVTQFHKAFEGKYKFDNSLYVLTSKQVAAARASLDTRAKINTYAKMYSDNEWSKTKADLLDEKEVLSSILDNGSAKNDLMKEVLDLQFNSFPLVRFIASVNIGFSETYSNLAQVDALYEGIYKKALDEYASYVKTSEEGDPILKKVFGLNFDKERQAKIDDETFHHYLGTAH